MNSQFQSLNFSYHDLSNKPHIVVSLDAETLPFVASEMWCFILHVPFAVVNLLLNTTVFGPCT
jgi:hypothetical protein